MNNQGCIRCNPSEGTAGYRTIPRCVDCGTTKIVGNHLHDARGTHCGECTGQNRKRGRSKATTPIVVEVANA